MEDLVGDCVLGEEGAQYSADMREMSGDCSVMNV